MEKVQNITKYDENGLKGPFFKKRSLIYDKYKINNLRYTFMDCVLVVDVIVNNFELDILR